MEEKTNGWVVLTYNHGITHRKFMVPSTFARTRSESIKNFVDGSGEKWKYWYKNFNYRCVKAQCVISTNDLK